MIIIFADGHLNYEFNFIMKLSQYSHAISFCWHRNRDQNPLTKKDLLKILPAMENIQEAEDFDTLLKGAWWLTGKWVKRVSIWEV